MERNKLLVIMHSNNLVYGAGKSLLYWINEANVSFDLVYPKSLIGKNDKDIFIREMHGLENIYCEWIPFSRCYLGKNGASIKGIVYQHLNNIMFYLNRKKIKKIIEKYDKIYLNSLVLWQLIRSEKNFYIHIREIFDGSYQLYEKISRNLEKTQGQIFIDYSTYEKFKDIKGSKIILNNPFNMKILKHISVDMVLKKIGLGKNKTVFSVIGMIYETKGVKFIIESFLETQIEAYLLIVGKIRGTYAKECIKLAKNNCNVIFLGEIKEIEEIYAISDYIIRGEPCFCIGRTIYEGLYSGCDVIVPGKQEDIQHYKDIFDIQENIHFYEARNKKSLIEQITNLKKIIKSERHFRSNIESYTKKIKKFMELDCEKE
ncbi:MAG: glycosyltransferase family 4 protein [Dorea sp.]|jgi:hypothetical protein|nr:glycosyltransferase family 4 protein [Dorea sp.]MCI9453954.1 glycosyltransferase family 4 protein [Dorea sp.]